MKNLYPVLWSVYMYQGHEKSQMPGRLPYSTLLIVRAHLFTMAGQILDVAFLNFEHHIFSLLSSFLLNEFCFYLF